MKKIKTFELFDNLIPLSKEQAKKTDHAEEGDMVDKNSSKNFNYSFVDPKRAQPGGFLITTKESAPFITDHSVKDTQVLVHGIEKPEILCNIIIGLTKDMKSIEDVAELLKAFKSIKIEEL